MKEKKYTLDKPEEETIHSIGNADSSFLVLYNDEIHTFDYVIESLIEVCDHDEIQAEQCTMIVHYKGQCDVKKGTPDTLSPYKEGLISRGLKAKIG
jgi:ATP-dependent Clp protease adaptor protein ClpS